MTHDDGYEDDPWADDPPGRLVPVADDFLPPADVIRRSIAQLSAHGMILFSLPPDDMKLLEKKAAMSGVNPADLITGILHDYATGQLIKHP